MKKAALAAFFIYILLAGILRNCTFTCKYIIYKYECFFRT